MTMPRPLHLTIVTALVAGAAALGFGAARWLSARPPVPAHPAAPATAAAARPSKLALPAAYLGQAGITVEPVARGGMDAEILTTGTVAARPNSEAVIAARVAGSVSRVLRQLGDTVRAGEVLAQVDSADAAAMAAARQASAARAKLARQAYAREQALFQQGVTPRQDLEAAQAALAVADTEAQRASAVARAAQVAADGHSVAVRSPLAGRITLSAATLGGHVQPETELFRVAAAGPVQVEAPVTAADIQRIPPGTKATILADGTAIEARVRAVTPTVSASTQAATVVLDPAAPAPQLVTGAGVQVRLHLDDTSTQLVVPEDAVQTIDGHDVLFVRTANGFTLQRVLVGRRSHGLAQIVSGVQPGTAVATRNAFLLKAELLKGEGDDE